MEFSREKAIHFSNDKSKGRFFSMPKDQLILHRFLGASEIKDAYKWKNGTHCPVCEKWQYTIIIYS